MKKVIFLLFIIAIISCSFQKSKREKFKTYFPSGKLQAITEMENGMKNGREEIYFENGNLFMVQYFKNDLLVDSFYQYAQDSPNVVVFKGFSSLRAHTVTLYSDNKIFGENDFKEKVIPDGLMKIYFNNGKTFNITTFVDGKKDGVDMTYFFNGNVRRIVHYQGGKKVPPIIEFDSTGKMINYVPATE